MRHLQLQKYLSLPQKGSVIAEYVWIDGSNGLRSKSKVSTFSLCLTIRRYRGCGICEHGVEAAQSELSLGALYLQSAFLVPQSPRMLELDIVSSVAALCDLTVQQSLPSVGVPYRRLQPTKPHDTPPATIGDLVKRLSHYPIRHNMLTTFPDTCQEG